MSIKRLKELEAEATPGSWYYDFGNQEIESRNETFWRMPILQESNLTERIWHCKEFRLTEDADPSRSSIDMELIAEMRNTLPKLLAVVEAAQRDSDPSFELAEALDALAALEKDK